MYDVITLGETMLRLTPAEGKRIEQATQFDIHVGGSESNTASGLARLGHRVAWLSRLTNNSLGRMLAASIAAHGVDTQHVLWTPQDRIGTYYYEPGSPPRNSQVIYDRQHSSFSRFSADMLPEELFSEGKSKYLHCTGISLGLGETCQKMIATSVQRARDAGWKISFDVNYRAKLWDVYSASQCCLAYLKSSDLVFLPIRDAHALFGTGPASDTVEKQPEQAARQTLELLKQISTAECIVLTLGPFGSAAMAGDQFHYQPTQPVVPMGRLGGGDAFSAGFLSGWLESGQAGWALRRGNAAAGLKYSIPGDLPYFTRDEVIKLESQASEEPQHFR